ncbi:MAG TPA: CoA-transferase [Anaerolineae bacterium]|nr:CoA-transferase [Anaerolineae bacterium]HOQ99425.1 CoA-transferase [Anaerolineae bacterium]HPL29954.1 CoA-transferase [Anaerolineae bacterium]
MPIEGYSPRKLQACAAARLLENHCSVFVGTGLPMIAAMLAQRTHAPGILIIFEAGGIGPQPPVLPISVGDSRTFYRAVAASTMHDAMSAAQAGHLDYGFLGAAQIDMYGNINTTVIGDWARPRARLPGSGGANDLGSFCHRTIIIMAQDRRRFVEQLDFLTTPGYLGGPGARERAGLPAGSGPYRVITQLGLYGFDEESKRMQLLSVHPGVTVAEVRENSAFELLIPEHVETTAPPSEEELRLLGEIDPMGISVGK